MKEVIAFFWGSHEYGLEISHMQSLENYREIVQLPESPSCILGTVTIRNQVYPVYDVGVKFGHHGSEITEDTKFLLVRTRAGNIAWLVDKVGKVFRVDGEAVQQFPAVAQTKETACIEFIAKRGSSLIVVMDPDKILEDSEAEEIKKLDLRKEGQEA